jgi:hypothetical protein
VRGIDLLPPRQQLEEDPKMMEQVEKSPRTCASETTFSRDGLLFALREIPIRVLQGGMHRFEGLGG